MLYRKIDTETGLFIEDVILDSVPTIVIDDELIPNPQYIDVPVADGFYHPKWNGEKWIEGLSTTKIEERKAQSLSHGPTSEERLASAESTILKLLLMA